jgi:hypothetical protein
MLLPRAQTVVSLLGADCSRCQPTESTQIASCPRCLTCTATPEDSNTALNWCQTPKFNEATTSTPPTLDHSDDQRGSTKMRPRMANHQRTTVGWLMHSTAGRISPLFCDTRSSGISSDDRPIFSSTRHGCHPHAVTAGSPHTSMHSSKLHVTALNVWRCPPLHAALGFRAAGRPSVAPSGPRKLDGGPRDMAQRNACIL